jgi:phosphoglycolate phosphatase
MISLLKPIDFSKIELLIFDLDGTLIDSKEDLARSSNFMRTQMGLPPLAHEVVFSYVGDGARMLIQRLLDHPGDDAELDRGLTIFLEYYREHMLDHTVLYPGVREAIEALFHPSNGNRRTLAVLTNKAVRFSRLILEGLGVADRFRFIYGGNSFEEKKPNPMGVKVILEEAGVPPEAALMVGDSDVDVLTGRNASIATCGVTYGLGAEKMRQTPPDVLVDDLRALVALLEGRAEQLVQGSTQTSFDLAVHPKTQVSD